MSTPAPADVLACSALGCRRTDALDRVRHDDTVRVLCPTHRKYFLGGGVMTLNDYAAPSCQFRDCDVEKMQEHPRHGEVQVCSTCAALWGRRQRMTAPPDETDSDFL